MKVYTVHIRRHGLDGDRDVVLVREGFIWTAFLFTVFWSLYHRLWLPAACIFATFLIIGLGTAQFGLGQAVSTALEFGFSVIIGFLAHDLRSNALRKAGFEQHDVVVADNQTHAEQRYFDNHPDLINMVGT